MADAYSDGYVLAARSISAGGHKGANDASFASPRNIWLFGSDGTAGASFSVGREFSHLAVDLNNSLWIGYRDKAGSWKPPANNAPTTGKNGSILLPGICRWTLDGNLSWVLARDPNATGRLFHCYSLNTGKIGTTAALDWENAVAIFRDEDPVEFYPTTTQSPYGLATDGETHLLLGRFEMPTSRGSRPRGFDVGTLYRLNHSRLDSVTETIVVMPDGSPLSGIPKGVSSRGKSILMHFDDPGTAFVLRL